MPAGVIDHHQNVLHLAEQGRLRNQTLVATNPAPRFPKEMSPTPTRQRAGHARRGARKATPGAPITRKNQPPPTRVLLTHSECLGHGSAVLLPWVWPLAQAGAPAAQSRLPQAPAPEPVHPPGLAPAHPTQRPSGQGPHSRARTLRSSSPHSTLRTDSAKR